MNTLTKSLLFNIWQSSRKYHTPTYHLKTVHAPEIICWPQIESKKSKIWPFSKQSLAFFSYKHLATQLSPPGGGPAVVCGPARLGRGVVVVVVEKAVLSVVC